MYVGEGDNHQHGVHVHHEEPPNRCDEPAAVYLFAEERARPDNGHGHHHHHHGHNHCGGDQHTKLFPDTKPAEVKIVPGGSGGSGEATVGILIGSMDEG